MHVILLFITKHINNKKTRNEYIIMYKKIAAEADKVRIKTHPLKRKTVPTTIFEEKEDKKEENLTVPDGMGKRSTRVLQQKENKKKYREANEQQK